MPNFKRVKRLSNILFGASGVLVFLIILNLPRFIIEEKFLSTSFILLIFCLILAISLRIVAKDAKEYVDRVTKLNNYLSSINLK